MNSSSVLTASGTYANTKTECHVTQTAMAKPQEFHDKKQFPYQDHYCCIYIFTSSIPEGWRTLMFLIITSLLMTVTVFCSSE